MSLSLILRLAWRDIRSGEMGLMLVALLVAVGTVTSISLFRGPVADRLGARILQLFGRRPANIQRRKNTPSVHTSRPRAWFGSGANLSVSVHGVSPGIPINWSA